MSGNGNGNGSRMKLSRWTRTTQSTLEWKSESLPSASSLAGEQVVQGFLESLGLGYDTPGHEERWVEKSPMGVS